VINLNQINKKKVKMMKIQKVNKEVDQEVDREVIQKKIQINQNKKVNRMRKSNKNKKKFKI
jgi:hypothetical protein